MILLVFKARIINFDQFVSLIEKSTIMTEIKKG